MGSDVKRIVLRLVEAPVRIMGMQSHQLLELVKECPKGTETLVTRIIHILTEKGMLQLCLVLMQWHQIYEKNSLDPPSQELVSMVRELYQTRVYDVRFLIPVLNGLSKKEVLAALPKLVALNPNVVKEVIHQKKKKIYEILHHKYITFQVFNRLLGTHDNETGVLHTTPVTPAELLIALHTMEPVKGDLKSIIKGIWKLITI